VVYVRIITNRSLIDCSRFLAGRPIWETGWGKVLISFLFLQTFKELESMLPTDKFCRVHNSFMVSIDKIEKIETNRIKVQKKIIPISDSYSKYFFERIK